MGHIAEFKLKDYVIVFGKYEGIIVAFAPDECLEIYCPDYEPDFPYVTTHVGNVELSSCQEHPSSKLSN